MISPYPLPLSPRIREGNTPNSEGDDSMHIGEDEGEWEKMRGEWEKIRGENENAGNGELPYLMCCLFFGLR